MLLFTAKRLLSPLRVVNGYFCRKLRFSAFHDSECRDLFEIDRERDHPWTLPLTLYRRVMDSNRADWIWPLLAFAYSLQRLSPEPHFY
jgi:hypothetical protein